MKNSEFCPRSNTSASVKQNQRNPLEYNVFFAFVVQFAHTFFLSRARFFVFFGLFFTILKCGEINAFETVKNTTNTWITFPGWCEMLLRGIFFPYFQATTSIQLWNNVEHMQWAHLRRHSACTFTRLFVLHCQQNRIVLEVNTPSDSIRLYLYMYSRCWHWCLRSRR